MDVALLAGFNRNVALWSCGSRPIRNTLVALVAPGAHLNRMVGSSSQAEKCNCSLLCAIEAID